MIDFEFQWIAGGHWYKTSLTPNQYAEALNSGMLHGKTLSSARIWQHEMDTITGYLTWNFEAAKQGNPGFYYSEPPIG